MRSRTLGRATLIVLIATGPVVTACEAVLDFDRTPLQPVYEAGAGEEEEEADASPDAPARPSGDAAQRPDARDGSSNVPVDSGMDAEGG